MRIAIGSDHAGFRLKEHLIAVLKDDGHDVDRPRHRLRGAGRLPDLLLARSAARSPPGDAERGIVLGGSGQGEQLSANKVKGVRAALCNDLYTAEYSRRHNDANVLSIGARVVGEGLADEILRVWLTTDFEGGRHQRRIDEITAIENGEIPT